MTNIQNLIQLVFCAHSALAAIEELDVPDEICQKYIRNAIEQTDYIFIRAAELMPRSEILKLVKSDK